MHHQQADPPAALRALIKDFWYLRRDFDAQQPSFEVAPDGYVELIFTFGSPCYVAASAGWQLLPSPFLVGLLPQPLRFRALGPLELVGIKCFPWALMRLLGLPPGPAGVQTLAHPLAQLQAPLAQRLAAGNVAAALAEAARYVGQLPLPPAGDPVLDKAGSALLTAAGTGSVRQVAAAAHTTVRTLERKFKQAAGHSVKDVAGLLRFEQVGHHLWRHPAASLAGLAQQLGYADQSHLGREFKRYSGTTPAAFARKAAQWQQTVSTDFVAFLLA
jgi:AraC-like DNA-binding protein